MGNLFGVRRRAPIVTAQDRAILQLKQQRDKIKIYQKKTEANLERNKGLALELFRNGYKERALIVLRRKKCMEEILSRTDNQLNTLEQLVSDIEFTQIEVSVVEGLKVGTEALKQLNSLMNIDDIQQMMEDNQEAADKQREISEILARSAVRFDEEDLLKELDAYAAANVIEQQPTTTTTTTTSTKEKVEQEEESPVLVKGDTEEEVKLPRAPTASTSIPEAEFATRDTDTIESKLNDLPAIPQEGPPQEDEEMPEEKRHKEKRKETARQLEPAQ